MLGPEKKNQLGRPIVLSEVRNMAASSGCSGPVPLLLAKCTDWGMRKGSGFWRFHQVQYKSTECPGCQEGQLHPGVPQAQLGQLGKGSDCPAVLHAGAASL